MKTRKLQSGFSLSEVLIAVGILLIGFMMVAGTFPVGIHLTAVSTERTLAASAADEAFAKIKLYGIDTSETNFNYFRDFNDILPSGIDIDASEFLYPSDSSASQNYNWSAIFRRSDANDISQTQVTVFVNRKLSSAIVFYEQDTDYTPKKNVTSNDPPKPILLGITGTQGSEKKIIEVSTSEYETDDTLASYVTDKSVILNGSDGKIYRVVDIDAENNLLFIDKSWEGPVYGFWVVPPPVNGGRYPCVGVYQKIINF